MSTHNMSTHKMWQNFNSENKLCKMSTHKLSQNVNSLKRPVAKSFNSQNVAKLMSTHNLSQIVNSPDVTRCKLKKIKTQKTNISKYNSTKSRQYKYKINFTKRNSLIDPHFLCDRVNILDVVVMIS